MIPLKTPVSENGHGLTPHRVSFVASFVVSFVGKSVKLVVAATRLRNAA